MKVKYQGVSLPLPIIEKVREMIEDDWRYTGVNSFVRSAVLEKIKRDYKKPVKR